MHIWNVVHKGLRRFIEDDDRSGLPAAVVKKIGKMISFLEAMEHEDELHVLTVWKVHQLGEDRAGVWSLHVTGNWRITFEIAPEEIEIIDLNYEDYH
jgi:toxin HigB-1